MLATFVVVLLFFVVININVVVVLTGSRVRHLDVSFNKLGSLGVELLLLTLPCDVITTLNLAATVTTPSANTLTRCVAKYLQQVQTGVQNN